MPYTWLCNLQEEARTKLALCYLNLADTELGRLHPVWDTTKTDPLTSYQASVRMRLLIQRYPLSTSHTAGKQTIGLCKLCEESEETITHFLLICSKLSQTRFEHLNFILHIFQWHGISIDPENMTKYIMDPMHFKFRNKKDTIHIEQHMIAYPNHVLLPTVSTQGEEDAPHNLWRSCLLCMCTAIVELHAN